jgi:hypothetical protein
MITHARKQGDLTVRHTRSLLTVRLPIDYVRTSTGLGYATTIHAAQGVSADTMHGLLTGQKSRRQLYTTAETGQHPLRHLQTAAAGRDLRTAGDMAAVLYWRLPELAPVDPGPLPWLPGIPETGLGALPDKAVPAGRRPRRPNPRSRLPR